MPRTRIADVLAEVFRTYGFDTTSPAHPEAQDGTIHRVDLLAEKQGLDIVVRVHEQSAPIDAPEIRAHADIRHAVGARYAIVATLSEITPASEDAAAETGALLWDREAIARAIGRAVLLEATGQSDLGETPVAELLSLSVTSTASVATPDETMHDLPGTFAGVLGLETDAPTATTSIADEHVAESGPQRETGRGWFLETNEPPPERRMERRAAPERLAARQVESAREWHLEANTPPRAAPVPSAPERREAAAQYAAPTHRMGIPQANGPDPHTFTPGEGVLMAPNVSKEAAAQTARRQVFTIDNTRLRFQPKRVVRWQVEAFVEGRVETTTLSGTLLVDLSSRTIEAPAKWETPRVLRNGIFDVPVEGKPVRMRPEHAQELVSETILEETSREVTLQDTDTSGDFHITVKRRVRISPEDIQVQDEGVHWYPVWSFTGVNGEVDVDGMTGTVLAAHLKGPKGTAMLW